MCLILTQLHMTKIRNIMVYQKASGKLLYLHIHGAAEIAFSLSTACTYNSQGVNFLEIYKSSISSSMVKKKNSLHISKCSLILQHKPLVWAIGRVESSCPGSILGHLLGVVITIFNRKYLQDKCFTSCPWKWKHRLHELLLLDQYTDVN